MKSAGDVDVKVTKIYSIFKVLKWEKTHTGLNISCSSLDKTGVSTRKQTSQIKLFRNRTSAEVESQV